MIGPSVLWASVSGVLRRILSVSIFAKVLGVGAIVAVIFGSVTLFGARREMSSILYRLLEERTVEKTRSLAAKLERPLTTGDLFTVQQQIDSLRRHQDEVRYIIVRDHTGGAVAHTFPNGVPPDLAQRAPQEIYGNGVRILGTVDGLLFEGAADVVKGYAGSVQLALTDRQVRAEVRRFTRSVLAALGVSATIGVALGLALTFFIAWPVRHLEHTAARLREGAFDSRARIFCGDEIGHLAHTVNTMAEGLSEYRREVAEKEDARQALIERLVNAQEEERRAISQELHDHLGQSLLALLLRLERSRGVPADVSADLGFRLRGIVEDVRRLAWGMRPSILDDFGLDSALARHTEEIATAAGIDIGYQYTQVPGTGRLPPPVEITLFRIVQEALSNVVRHAEASSASVVVLQRRDEVTLLVEDDGCGFDAVGCSRARGLGLGGMRERVALVGGRCDLESSLGRGTVVRVRIPGPREKAA